MTHTKTFTQYDAWAQSIPLGDPAQNGWHVGDHCHAPQCDETLQHGEVYYYVTELDSLADGREPCVCWRHVRSDDGPIII